MAASREQQQHAAMRGGSGGAIAELAGSGRATLVGGLLKAVEVVVKVFK